MDHPDAPRTPLRPPTGNIPWMVAWSCVGLGGALVLAMLIQYWMKDYESADRILIIFAAAWAAYTRWPAVQALPLTPRPVWGLPLVLLGPVLFLPPWFVYLQVGPRPILMWWGGVSVLLSTAGLLLMRHGWPAVRALRFPLIFPFLALPLPGRIMGPVQGYLQDATTTIAAQALRILGISVERHGFLLTLPSGDLGVVEACSGVRSVVALVAIAWFLANLRGFGLVRTLLTLILAIPIIIVVNALRVTLTGILQENIGVDAIIGWKHEVLGMAMVLLGLGIIVVGTGWLARLTTRPTPDPEEPVPALPPSTHRPRGGRITAAWLLAIAAAGAGLVLVPPLTQPAEDTPDLQRIPHRFGAWVAPQPDPPFDPDVARSLGLDHGLHRVYQRLGYDVHVWVMHWQSSNGVRDYHHPDVCWPNRGFGMNERRIEMLETPAGRTIPLTYREFARGRDRQLVVYWTQEGRRIWGPEDEQLAISPIYPIRWMGYRVLAPDRAHVDDRLAVLVGLPSWNGEAFARAGLHEVTGHLADELYGVCPWADPRP